MAQTKLNLNVDARQLGGLEKMLRRVFSRKMPAEFNKGMTAVNRELARSHREMGQLVRAMGEVERGTEKFKRLKDRLKEVNDEMRVLKSAMNQVGGGPGGGGGGGSRGGGRGGGRLGQIPTPSIGGLAAALGAIPVAGAMAAGGLMAAAGAYGSNLSWQQARMSNAAYLMPSSGMAGFQGASGTRPGGSPFGGYGSATNAELLGEAAGLASEVSGWKRLTGMLSRRRQPKKGADPLARANGAALASGSGEMHPDVQGPEQFYAADKTYDAWQYARAGALFGLTPQQALAQAGGAAQAAGAPIGAGDFGGMLAMQQLYGVSTQAQGAHMLASRWTGGDGSVQEVADIMADVRDELNGSELAMLLQEQTGWLRGMYNQGNDVSAAGMAAGAGMLKASGVSDPFRYYGYARSFGGAAAAAGRAGPSNGAHMRLMRSMGYTGAGGFEEYAKYSMKMQNPGDAAEAMGSYLQSFSGMGGENTQALMIQRAMAAFGTQITAKDAMSLAGGIKDGTLKTGDLKKMLASGSGLAGATGSAVIGAAGIEAERIGVGARVTPAMQALERATLNIAELVTGKLGASIDRFAGLVEEGSDRLGSALLMDPYAGVGGRNP